MKRRPMVFALLSVVLLPFVSPFVAMSQGTQEMPFRGKHILVTGSTDGLGREVALALANGGAHVVIHGRNAERGQAVVAEIQKEGKGTAAFFAADFASLEAVRAFADTIAKYYPKLDALVNNAGVLVPANSERRTSADGHELHFAVNYLAGWVLVHRLRPALAAGSPSRIINVASISASPIDFTDFMLERPGAARRGYGQSKLAQIMMTVELAPEYATSGITMVALHPATLMNTNMVRSGGLPVRATVNEGRDAVLRLFNAPTLTPGAYFNGEQVGQAHAQASDAAARAQLRELSARLTKVP